MPSESIEPGELRHPARVAETRGAGEFGIYTPLARRVGAIIAAILLLVVLVYLGVPVLSRYIYNIEDSKLLNDFSAFWAGARLFLDGRAIEAFDRHAVLEVQSLEYVPGDHIFLWLYPPLFQILVSPLGFFDIFVGFAVFSVLGVLAYAAALRSWADGMVAAPTLALASPAAALAIYYGNVSLFWAAILLFALRELCRGREASAGLLIALLTVKPQLGLLIPVALLAGGHWRAIAWAVAGSLLTMAVCTAVFGFAYWSEFVAAINEMSRIIAGTGNALDPVNFHYQNIPKFMISWYAFGRELGLEHARALWLHAVIFVAAAASIAFVWRQHALPFGTKAAVLCLALLIGTPYAFSYELVLAVSAALLLAGAGYGRHALGRAILALLWLLPVPGEVFKQLGDFRLVFAHYVAPLLTISLLLVMWHSLRSAPTATGAAARG